MVTLLATSLNHGCPCRIFINPSGHFLHQQRIPFQHIAQNYRCRPRVYALFWGSRKTVEPPDTTLLLGDFSLTGSGSEVSAANSFPVEKVSLSVISSISEVSSTEWDACALDANGPEKFNPFLTHGFLSSLEESGSSVKETGWIPRHIVAKDEANNVIGVVPLYLKRNTTDNKWGTPYLTRDFFHNMASKMGDQVLLVIAEDQGEPVAGALNLIGGDTLYGRLWGCLQESYYPSLHFEACYYQAIEAAIEFNLDKVEAGAQGEHKIQRGYLPVTTFSCHYIVDEEFRKAIEDFLVRETAQVKLVMKLLHESSPFKDDIHWGAEE